MIDEPGGQTDRDSVKAAAQLREQAPAAPGNWSVRMRAISIADPETLVQTLTGAILGCGGWVLSRGASDAGVVNLLFEFERRICIDVYSMLVASGIELSRGSHIRFTELCRCSRFQSAECASEVTGIDLEIQTFSINQIQEQETTNAV